MRRDICEEAFIYISYIHIQPEVKSKLILKTAKTKTEKQKKLTNFFCLNIIP